MMMKMPSIALLILGVLFCEVAYGSGKVEEEPKVPLPKDIKDAGVLTAGPFKGIKPAALPEPAASLIFSANYDFQRVLESKEPVYAVKDGSSFRDGGTQVFKGVGYKLIRVSSITEIAGVSGFTAGVTIIFDDKLAPGNNKEFSQTRFVSLNK